MRASGGRSRRHSNRAAALCVALAFTVLTTPAASGVASAATGHLTLTRHGNTVAFKLSFPKPVDAIRINFSPSNVIVHDNSNDAPGSTASGFAPDHCMLGGGARYSFECNTSLAADGKATLIPAGTSVIGIIHFSHLAAPYVASADGAIPEPSIGGSSFLLHTPNANF
jgi:hypothetical protein